MTGTPNSPPLVRAMPDQTGETARHVPVLLAEVLTALTPAAGAGETAPWFLDGTFGAGGYSAALLAAVPGSRVLGIDRDPNAIADAAPLVERWAGRLKVAQARFSDMAEVWQTHAPASGRAPDGIVLDIGVSSMQLDDPARGFSFQKAGPLDMRMAQDGPSAADLLASLDAEAIADILYRYGDEKRSRAIARTIVATRTAAPLRTTTDLARLVEKVLGRPRDADKHPATRTFQALRIAVNDELGELEGALTAAEGLLAPGGRLAVVTFHSLEDRIVKEFFRERTGNTPRGSRFAPETAALPATFRFEQAKPVAAGEAEVASNRRARSAHLRWAIRTAAPARPG